MKICLYSDVHWSTYSSILRKRGDNYSIRLEGLIQSLNWVEQVAKDCDCQQIYCLGDFFDQPMLSAEEISAIKEVKWADLPHFFIVGNHEMGRNDLFFNSTDMFGLSDNFHVIKDITKMSLNDRPLTLIPYMLNYDTTISDIVGSDKNGIILMHNDIKGIQMGPVTSKCGFDIDDISKNCAFCVNGHLHNGEQIADNIINIGNLTGQNFSEDAVRYEHHAMIIDTDTLEYKFIKNPFAFNFYKFDLCNKTVAEMKHVLSSIDNNAIITLKCNEVYKDKINDLLPNDKIIEKKIIFERTLTVTVNHAELLQVDHLKQFHDYIISSEGRDEIVSYELSEVLR